MTRRLKSIVAVVAATVVVFAGAGIASAGGSLTALRTAPSVPSTAAALATARAISTMGGWKS